MICTRADFAIDGNVKHQFYAIDLEVLCSLPGWPRDRSKVARWTPLVTLCRDFGFKLQRELRAVFARLLKSWGIKIEVRQLMRHEGAGLGLNGTVAKGLGARIDPSCSRDAQKIGQANWDKVNPDDGYTRDHAWQLAVAREKRGVANDQAAQMPGV